MSAEEEQRPSRTAGGCVLAVLVGVATAAVFAIAPAAGVLTVWVAGVAALAWAARRRVSDSSAAPPPEAVAPAGDVLAVERMEVARVVPIAEGVGCILHPVREEVNER